MIKYILLTVFFISCLSCKSNSGVPSSHSPKIIKHVDHFIAEEPYKEKVTCDEKQESKEESSLKEEDSGLEKDRSRDKKLKHNGDRKLRKAICDNDVALIKELLDAGVNLNNDNDIYFPLHTAVIRGNKAAVRLLLDYGADPMVEHHKQNAIHCCNVNGNHEILEILLIHLGLRGQKDEGGLSPLHWASKDGHTGVVRALVASGQTLNYNEREPLYDFTPLHWAARRGRTEIIEMLLSKGADKTAVSKHGFTPLMLALANNHNNLIELLSPDNFKRNYIKKIEGECPICLEGLITSRKLGPIITLECHPTHQFHVGCLSSSIHDKENKMCPLCRGPLSDDFVTKYSSKNHSLLQAVYNNDVAKVRELLSKPCHIDERDFLLGGTALLASIDKGYKDIFDELLQHGADPNFPDALGNYPITTVAEKSFRSDSDHFVAHAMVELIKHGAHVNQDNGKAKTALEHCTLNYHPVLYEAGGVEDGIVFSQASFGLSNYQENDKILNGSFYSSPNYINLQKYKTYK